MLGAELLRDRSDGREGRQVGLQQLDGLIPALRHRLGSRGFASGLVATDHYHDRAELRQRDRRGLANA